MAPPHLFAPLAFRGVTARNRAEAQLPVAMAGARIEAVQAEYANAAELAL